MIGNKFKYAIIDLSMLLYRNSWVISKGKNPGEYSAGEIIQMTIWSLNKFARDYGITADKFIFAVDKWDPAWNGYYTTYLLGGAYKDSRGDIEDAKGKADPLSTYMKKKKFEELKKDPSIYLPGYEADNLMYLASMLLYDPTDKPSVMITKDSDISYCTSPKMLQFKMPVGKSEAKFITYEEMYNDMPQEVKDLGISLYQYKAFLDSMGAEGHNGMRKSIKDRVNAVEAIQHIMNGDYSDLEDYDLFSRQMETFDISKYPRFEEAKRQILEILPTTGGLGSISDFHKFCDKYGITKISDRYYTEFISRFDPTLYCGR